MRAEAIPVELCEQLSQFSGAEIKALLWLFHANTLRLDIILTGQDLINGTGLSSEELEPALASLEAKGWVTFIEEGEEVLYGIGWESPDPADEYAEEDYEPPPPLPRPPPRGHDSLVYFVEFGAGGHIKIGTAANVVSRLKSMQTASPLPLRVLGTCQGGIELERRLHADFAHSRARDGGEWFEPTAALLERIAELTDQSA